MDRGYQRGNLQDENVEDEKPHVSAFRTGSTRIKTAGCEENG